MPRQKAANLVKGCAWLFLAAAALPTFSTGGEGSGEVTELAVGLPWSPWLIYRESWLPSESTQAAAPTFGYETHIEPRSWSAATMLVGFMLLVASRVLKASGRKHEQRPSPAAFGPTSALGA